MFAENHSKETVAKVVEMLRDAADKLESGDAALNHANLMIKREFYGVETKEIELSFMESDK